MINILGTILPVLSGGWAAFGYMLGKDASNLGKLGALMLFAFFAGIWILVSSGTGELDSRSWKAAGCILLIGVLLTGFGFGVDYLKEIDTNNSAYTETVDTITESSNSEYTIIGETDEVVIMQDENGNFIAVDKNN